MLLEELFVGNSMARMLEWESSVGNSMARVLAEELSVGNSMARMLSGELFVGNSMARMLAGESSVGNSPAPPCNLPPQPVSRPLYPWKSQESPSDSPKMLSETLS